MDILPHSLAHFGYHTDVILDHVVPDLQLQAPISRGDKLFRLGCDRFRGSGRHNIRQPDFRV